MEDLERLLLEQEKEDKRVSLSFQIKSKSNIFYEIEISHISCCFKLVFLFYLEPQESQGHEAIHDCGRTLYKTWGYLSNTQTGTY